MQRPSTAQLVRRAIDALHKDTDSPYDLPLVCDPEGRLRLSPGRLAKLWGHGVTPHLVGRQLRHLKLHPPERAHDSPTKAWAADHARLAAILSPEQARNVDIVMAFHFGVHPSPLLADLPNLGSSEA